MRASHSWLNNLCAIAIVCMLVVGIAVAQPVDRGEKSKKIKVTKTLSEKVNSLPPEEKVRVIITLKKPAGQFRAQAARSSVKEDILAGGGKVKREYSIFEGMAAEIPASKMVALANNSNVKLIVEDRPVRAFLTESVPLINADDVWIKIPAGASITGSGQTICVIDSGVDYNHPDLGGGKGAGFKVLGGYDFVNDDDDPMDDNGHGTHVAGIVAANGTLKGVAPDANIIAIKALNVFGLGSVSDILAGIDWCVSNASTYNITVISMSLGGDLYTSYCDNELNEIPFRNSINAAVTNNINVIVATGNDANYTAISSPACIQNATRVGATYDANVGSKTWSSGCTDATTSADQIVCITNRGANFSDMLLAPGALINSTYLSDGYNNMGGTSMATPHVSGLIALLNQEYKVIYGINPAPSYLFDVMNSTGVQIYDSKTNRNYSRIDALAAYNAIYPFSEIYSDDLDDDGNNWDNNFTASYNASSNTPVWSDSSDKINLTDANTGEGKLIIINGTGLLYDGNGDYDLKDANTGDDYILYNGLYVVDGCAGIVQLAYELVLDVEYSNGDGNINAGEVVLIKGDKYFVADNETSDSNIKLGPAIAKMLTATTVDKDNAVVISGSKKMLYGDNGQLYFYEEASLADLVNISNSSFCGSFPCLLDPYISSDEFGTYNISVIFRNVTTAKVALMEKSELVSITNDEGAFGYNRTKINDASFPKLNEIIFLSDNVSLVEYQYVNVLDTYYSIYFDGNKYLDIFRRNTTPPNITSGPTVSSVTTSQATITWTTDEASDSTVEYGTNTSYGSTIGNSSLVTSHSLTLTGLSSSTTYHYRVISSDFLGNNITSEDYNFTTSTPTTTITSTGGGGPAPKDVTTTATVTDGKATTTISVSAGKTGTITIPDTADIPFKEIAIKVLNRVTNVQITIYKLAEKPSDIVEDIKGLTHSYIQIDEENIKATDIDTVTITFKVPVSWVDDNNIDKATVVLNRYADENWTALTTTKTSEDSENVHYSAVSPRLSVFAIAGQVVKTPETMTLPRIATVPTTMPPTTTPPTEPPTTAPPAEEPKPLAGKIILAILAIVIIAGAAYYQFVMKKGGREGEAEASEEVQETAEKPAVEEPRE